MATEAGAFSEGFEEGGSLVRRVITLVVILCVVGAAAYAGWSYFIKDDSKAVATVTQQEATVTKGNLVSTFATTGTAQSTLTSKLTFSSSGSVKSVSVTVGTEVKAGQELARLDDKDAGRKLDSAASNLETAKLRLAQLSAPPTAADLASAQQSVTSAEQQVISARIGVTNAQSNLANAQANLDKALAGPSSTDVTASDNAVSQAQNSLINAQNNVASTFSSLGAAQRDYCYTNLLSLDPPKPCGGSDIPLSAVNIAAIQNLVASVAGAPKDVAPVVQVGNSFLSANNSYRSAQNGVVTAQQSLDLAKQKRADLNLPPEETTLIPLRNSISNAQNSITTAQGNVANAEAGLVTAKARYDTVVKGSATATDIALQEQSVKQSELSYQTQVDVVDALILKAPFDGTIAAVGVAAGDNAGAATAAFTLTNPNAVRIDLAIQESELRNLKVGQFGITTFDALPGSTFLIKITAISNTATVTQGVVTYTAQAEILRGPALQDPANQAALASVQGALTTLLGGRTTLTAGTGGGGQGGPGAAQRTPPAAVQTAIASGTPLTGGAGGPGGGGAAGGRGGAGATGGIAGLFNAAPPTPGMNATVTIILALKENVLLVPTNAVRRQGTQQVVNFKKEDGTTELRPVTVGGTDSTNSEITEGLAEGDKLVLGTTTTAAGTNNSRTPAAGQQGGAFIVPVGGGGGGNQNPGGVR
jgi:multidrug efflux pump subunit AcrA (membrane-fusion protein)